MKTILFFILLSSIATATEVFIEARQWTTDRGRSFTASVTEIKGGKVMFFADGNDFVMPLDSMSFDDRTDLRSALMRALTEKPALMEALIAHDVEMYDDIRRITLDRKARGAGYHQMDEYEKNKNMAREAKYRSQELALASMSQINAISGMVQSMPGYGNSMGGGGYYGGNSGRIHVRGHYNNGHWVRPYTRSR